MYHIKKIMQGISFSESKCPEVRIDIVMDGMSEKGEKAIEEELKIFVEKISGIVIADTNTIPTI